MERQDGECGQRRGFRSREEGIYAAAATTKKDDDTEHGTASAIARASARSSCPALKLWLSSALLYLLDVAEEKAQRSVSSLVNRGRHNRKKGKEERGGSRGGQGDAKETRQRGTGSSPQRGRMWDCSSRAAAVLALAAAFVLGICSVDSACPPGTGGTNCSFGMQTLFYNHSVYENISKHPRDLDLQARLSGGVKHTAASPHQSHLTTATLFVAGMVGHARDLR